jgi:hypothetical protein
MRIRTVKPEFWKDEELAKLTPWARLLFIGLWGLADKEGLLKDEPGRIKAEIFPYNRIRIEDLLAELSGVKKAALIANGVHDQQSGPEKADLIANGVHDQQSGPRPFIIRYEVNGLKIIWVRTFKKHQRISGKEAESISIYPKPKTSISEAPPPTLDKPPTEQPGSTGETIEKQPGSNGEATEKQPGSTGEAPGSPGKEGKGKEREGEGGSIGLPPPPDDLLSQVKWIKSIRKEFEALRDVDIENALTGCPDVEQRKAGMRDFGRDMIGALELPPIPTKKLRGYLYRAEKDAAKTPALLRPGSGQAGGSSSGVENLSVEDLVERANDALARKGL